MLANVGALPIDVCAAGHSKSVVVSMGFFAGWCASERCLRAVAAKLMRCAAALMRT